LDILQLRYFLTTAETENITKAAERIHIAQPALSQAISKLEHELELKLFDRVGKSIRINDNGKLLTKRAREALSILDNVKAELRELEDSEGGTIRLRVMVGSGIIPGLLAEFREECPDIHFQLAHLEPGGEQGMCITTPINGILPETSRLLLEEEIMLAVPQSHPLAQKGAINLSQVRDESFLSLDPNKPLRQITDIFCNAAGFAPDIVMQADNPSTLRDMIALGLGIAFAPAVTWSELRSSCCVSLLHITKPVCKRSLCITWNADRYLTGAEHKFLNFASQYFFHLREAPARQGQTV
jgi:DNA-binding transcriptional LysR family regulator